MQKILYLIIALLCMVVQGAWAQTEVLTEDELTSAITDGASIKLMADIALTNYVNISDGKTVTIDLNGHTLDRRLSERTDLGNVIRVQTGSTLTITDGAGGGTITGGYDSHGGGITAGHVAGGVRLFFGDYSEDTGITTTNFTDFTNSDNAWYSLDGRKLATKPTAKGVYINKGRKQV